MAEATAQPRGGTWDRLWKAGAWLPALGVAVVVLLLAARVLDYFTHSWSVLFFPWQMHYDEGPNVNAAWLMSQSVNIYRPNEPDHFISATHTPLYYVLNAAAMKVWGLNLLSGRLIAFVSAISIGAMLWAWVYIETRRPIAGALSCILWFSLGPVYVWSTLYKQDMLALALSLAGALLVARGKKDEGRERNSLSEGRNDIPHSIYWAILPLSLAFWTKQSSIVAIGAVVLFLLLYDRRLALRWSVIATASIVVPFLTFDLYTDGGLHEHMLAFRHYELALTHFVRNLRVLWTYETPLILCGLAFAMNSLWSALKRRSSISLSALYLLITIPAAVLSMAVPTANYSEISDMPIAKYNEFLEPLALFCLSVGLGLGVTWRKMVETNRGSRSDWAWLTGGVIFLSLLYAAMSLKQTGPFWYPVFSQPFAERAQQMEEISKLVRATPGEVLSEDIWLLLKNGRVVRYDDPALMAVLAREGQWDQSMLLQDITRRKFSYVITSFDPTATGHSNSWSDQALAAVQRNYNVALNELPVGIASSQR